MRRCRRRPSQPRAAGAPRPGGGWSRPPCWCSSSSARDAGDLVGARRARRAPRSYRVLGDLAGIRLDLGDADVEIDGGATAVEVRRVDRFAFGAPGDERRSVEDGTLTSSRAARTRCSAPAARPTALTVPDNVPLEIETSSGSVQPHRRARLGADQHRLGRDRRHRLLRLPAARDVGLRRRPTPLASAPPTGSSCARAAATCAPSSPPAATRSTRRATPGTVRIRGLTPVDDAPFQIQALSTSGDVTVRGRLVIDGARPLAAPARRRAARCCTCSSASARA